MQTIVWIVIILIAVLLIWCLRKWIKRLIFILIFLILAFFIYWIFSPSWASRLWYNVKTFPKRVNSWVSNQKFLDYDTYRLDISSVGAKEDSDIVTSVSEDKDIKWLDSDSDSNSKKNSKVNNVKSSEGEATKKSDYKNKWYSASDVLAVINKYIKDNLDDDTDILVTIEYNDDNDSPEKIVLKTQNNKVSNKGSLSIPRFSVKNFSDWLNHSRTSITSVISWDYENSKNSVVDDGKNVEKQGKSQKQDADKSGETKSYNWLTQLEVKEAEELFSILF